MREQIYLDNGAATQPSSDLLSQIQPYFRNYWHSIEAPYLQGKQPFASVEEARTGIVDFLDAEGNFFFAFTSSGAEGISQVVQSVYFDEIYQSGKNHFLTTPLENKEILLALKKFEKVGCITKMATLNEHGQITKERLEKALSPRTSLLSLSWASSLTGVVQPIEEIASLCKEKGILLHVDASDVLGKIYFSLEKMQIDFLTFGGDRLHAPKGSGGILYKSKQPLFPLISGESLNLPALVGLGFAFEELKENFDYLCTEGVRLKNKLEEGILNGVEHASVLFQEAERLPHVTAIAFPGIPSELLSFHLMKQGLFVSRGGGREQQLTSLLISAGIDPIDARCSLSFSLSRDTTEEEIDQAIKLVISATDKCFSLSRRVL
ncbi:MAG: aminotransferase class V-fold PLP-dependent enzyme [Simkania negevensis]|nr:aminotransferase class V-fold PLP-dependent enzyme [Simkania negevensis]